MRGVFRLVLRKGGEREGGKTQGKKGMKRGENRKWGVLCFGGVFPFWVFLFGFSFHFGQ